MLKFVSDEQRHPIFWSVYGRMLEEALAGTRFAIYCGGSLVVEADDGDSYSLSLGFIEHVEAPEAVRILHAKIYIANKTPKHAYWIKAQSILKSA
jgi:hypothetical protein